MQGSAAIVKDLEYGIGDETSSKSFFDVLKNIMLRTKHLCLGFDFEYFIEKSASKHYPD